MPYPAVTRPDLSSKRTPSGRRSLPKESAAGAAPTATRRSAITRPHPWRAASTGHPPVHRGGRPRRGGHRGVRLLLARLRCRPGTRRDRDHRPARSPPRSTASSTPARWWCCTQPGTACQYPPSPGGCSRWESQPPSRRTWHRAGPTVPSARWSRPGRRLVLARTSFWSGSSAPAGRQTEGRRQSISALVWPAVLRSVVFRLQPLTASAPEGISATRQPRHGGPQVGRPGSRPSPSAGSATMRRLRPAPPMTRRWPRTGSASRPAIGSQNAGSPRCSDAHPAAGREPGSPMHDR